jgi:hypothetical protein
LDNHIVLAWHTLELLDKPSHGTQSRQSQELPQKLKWRKHWGRRPKPRARLLAKTKAKAEKGTGQAQEPQQDGRARAAEVVLGCSINRPLRRPVRLQPGKSCQGKAVELTAGGKNYHFVMKVKEAIAE